MSQFLFIILHFPKLQSFNQFWPTSTFAVFTPTISSQKKHFPTFITMFLEKLLHNQKKAVDPGGTDLRDFCINTRLQVHILRFLEWVISLEVQLTLSLNHFSRLILVNCPFNLLKTRVCLENDRFTTGLIFMGFSSGMNLLYVLYLFRFGWSCDVCLIYLIWVLLQFFSSGFFADLKCLSLQFIWWPPGAAVTELWLCWSETFSANRHFLHKSSSQQNSLNFLSLREDFHNKSSVEEIMSLVLFCVFRWIFCFCLL